MESFGSINRIAPNIWHGDAIEFLSHCPKYTTIIADPPDNIGLAYGKYKDMRPSREYFDWIDLLLHKALQKCDVMWLSMYHKNAIETAYRVRVLLRGYASWKVRTVIWKYTFGQYNDNDMPNGYRPIFLFQSHWAKMNWDAIRVPSTRMEMGDPRAAGPRIPDDVWEFPRVVGNHKDRCDWHPTQHPTELYARMLSVSTTTTKDRAIDLFGGTGTIFRAAHDLGIQDQVHYLDIDEEYCHKVLTHEEIRKGK